MDGLHNSTTTNGGVLRQVEPLMAVKNRLILPKIESKNNKNKRNEYFNMTLNEKILYRRKLNFTSNVGLVTKEESVDIMKKIIPRPRAVFS